MMIKNFAKTVVRHRLWRPVYLNRILRDQLGRGGTSVDYEQALHNIFQWLLKSFEVTGDGGSSAYYALGSGWQSSYPETTGYLIPTLYDYYDRTQDKKCGQTHY